MKKLNVVSTLLDTTKRNKSAIDFFSPPAKKKGTEMDRTTVDGRNPAPHGMYLTLSIRDKLPINWLARFQPSTVACIQLPSFSNFALRVAVQFSLRYANRSLEPSGLGCHMR